MIGTVGRNPFSITRQTYPQYIIIMIQYCQCRTVKFQGQICRQRFKIVDILFFAQEVVNRREPAKGRRNEARAALRTHILDNCLSFGRSQCHVRIEVAHHSSPQNGIEAPLRHVFKIIDDNRQLNRHPSPIAAKVFIFFCGKFLQAGSLGSMSLTAHHFITSSSPGVQ
jgi:hypothetical protein